MMCSLILIDPIPILFPILIMASQEWMVILSESDTLSESESVTVTKPLQVASNITSQQ